MAGKFRKGERLTAKRMDNMRMAQERQKPVHGARVRGNATKRGTIVTGKRGFRRARKRDQLELYVVGTEKESGVEYRLYVEEGWFLVCVGEAEEGSGEGAQCASEEQGGLGDGELVAEEFSRWDPKIDGTTIIEELLPEGEELPFIFLDGEPGTTDLIYVVSDWSDFDSRLLQICEIEYVRVAEGETPPINDEYRQVTLAGTVTYPTEEEVEEQTADAAPVAETEILGPITLTRPAFSGGESGGSVEPGDDDTDCIVRYTVSFVDCDGNTVCTMGFSEDGRWCNPEDCTIMLGDCCSCCSCPCPSDDLPNVPPPWLPPPDSSVGSDSSLIPAETVEVSGANPSFINGFFCWVNDRYYGPASYEIRPPYVESECWAIWDGPQKLYDGPETTPIGTYTPTGVPGATGNPEITLL
jgi:hypothetical protein